MTIEISNATIRLVDLALTSNPIRGLVATNVTFVGPAIMAFTSGSVQFDNTTFDGSVESLLWDLEPGRKAITGAVAVEDATFRNCRFTAIGLTAAPEDLKRLVNMITLKGA